MCQALTVFINVWRLICIFSFIFHSLVYIVGTATTVDGQSGSRSEGVRNWREVVTEREARRKVREGAEDTRPGARINTLFWIFQLRKHGLISTPLPHYDLLRFKVDLSEQQFLERLLQAFSDPWPIPRKCILVMLWNLLERLCFLIDCNEPRWRSFDASIKYLVVLCVNCTTQFYLHLLSLKIPFFSSFIFESRSISFLFHQIIAFCH